ncbi:hypothetical protein L6R49_04315 [Myxococcota bacterium]|nr:hypothetical protein [Myxococcota bacterium]
MPLSAPMTLKDRVFGWLSGSWRPPWALPAAAVAALGLSVALNGIVVGVYGVEPVPDLLHPATPETLVAALDALGPTLRAAYVKTAFLDVFYPLAYGVAISGALARLAPPALRWLPYLLPLTVAADLTENLFFVGLAAEVWPRDPVVLTLACAANAVKWLTADVAILSMVLLGLWRAARWARG